ncbi:MAG: ABC transporter permease [Polyangiaceae bacterium]
MSLFARLFADPNPIFVREVKQSARLGRTPWLLFSVALLLTLFMCSVGGIASASSTSPAQIGRALFQVFFSAGFLVVTLVGPALAANSIASEREGRTWEAVLLAGLDAKHIARGKFQAAYTSMALYLVVLAPVGALPFLYGGVTAAEIVTGYVFLFLLAALTVAFGLAVSSQMASLRGAIVVTLILAVILGPNLYGFGGFGLSVAINSLWKEVDKGLPIWLPVAYARAPFGVEYVLFLIVFPLLVIGMPAWFLYEITIANLSDANDDRSSGLKRWFAVTTPLLAVALAVPTFLSRGNSETIGWAIVTLSFYSAYLTFVVLLFAGEPFAPSRRVHMRWLRTRASGFTRAFGPGLMRTMWLVLLVGLLGYGILAAVSIYSASVPKATTYAYPSTRADDIAAASFASYAALFFVFVLGMTTWLRTKVQGALSARIIALAVLFLVSAGPWFVAILGGILSDKDNIFIAAPSPFYAFYMAVAAENFADVEVRNVAVGAIAAASWAFLGLLLFGFASRRSARAILDYESQVAATEAALAAEDAARAAPPPSPSAMADAVPAAP